MKRFTLISAALLSTCAFAATAAMTLPAFQQGESVERNDRIEFRADLEGPATLASGRARYRAETRGPAVRARFDVSIEDADPKTSYEVAINGTVIGSITTNAFGMGEVTFRSPSDDPDDVPGTPSVRAGDVVSVGPISGVLN
jgi:hypothetical protein